MRLGTFSFRGIRNLEPATLDLAPGLNLLTGENAAGKSAFLEAVYLLTTARSFRSSRLRSVVSWGAPGFIVNGHFSGSDAETASPSDGLALSHRYDGAESLIQLGTATRLKRLELLSRVPSLFVGAESLKFFEDGPGFRRQQLDIGSFHVEHAYIDSWRRYRRALSQRNALLRSSRNPSAQQIAPWDQEMSEHAVHLHQCRRQFSSTMQTSIAGHFERLGLPQELKIAYRPGWDPERSLSEQLNAGLDKDLSAGYTLRGPHRDDLLLLLGKRAALSALSRGQQKAFMLALFLSLADVINKYSGTPPLLLIDDLGAELDSEHQRRVMDHLDQSNIQALVTTVVGQPTLQTPANCRLFHVEQGLIKRCYNGADTTTATD